MNNNVLLDMNDRANNRYRGSYNGISGGKGEFANDLVNFCREYPSLSEEVNLYYLPGILGDELAEVVVNNISGMKEDTVSMQR